MAALIYRRRRLRRTGLLLVGLGRLVEMRTEAVDAGRPRGVGLLVLGLGCTLGHLLRRSLAL
jgi:hypothetical protein